MACTASVSFLPGVLSAMDSLPSLQARLQFDMLVCDPATPPLPSYAASKTSRSSVYYSPTSPVFSRVRTHFFDAMSYQHAATKLGVLCPSPLLLHVLTRDSGRCSSSPSERRPRAPSRREAGGWVSACRHVGTQERRRPRRSASSCARTRPPRLGPAATPSAPPKCIAMRSYTSCAFWSRCSIS
jgi:hypothetical protein